MSDRLTPLVGLSVLAVHGLAVAALVTQAPTPPQLQSAPPIYGSLVSAPPQETPPAPKPVPKPAAPAVTPAPEPEPEPAPQTAPEPVPETVMEQAQEKAQEKADDAPTVIPPKVDASARQNPPPVYPSTSRRRGEEGTVVLAIHIDARGRVTAARVARSSGHARLDRVALEAVRHWRYQPATRAGVAIAWDYRQPVVFSLSGR
ncbi:MAG: energy transducer TonB [Alcanivoracaceae bacterium]